MPTLSIDLEKELNFILLLHNCEPNLGTIQYIGIS